MKQLYIFILLFLPFMAAAQSKSAKNAACDSIFENGKKALNSKDFKNAFNYFAVVKECNPEKQKEIDSLIDIAYTQIKDELDKTQKLVGYFVPQNEKAGWLYDYANDAFKVVDRDGKELTTAKYYEPQPFQNGVGLAKDIFGIYVFVGDSVEKVINETTPFLHFTDWGYYLGISKKEYGFYQPNGKLIARLNIDAIKKNNRHIIFQKQFIENVRKIGTIDALGDFEKGLAKVYSGAKWGIIDSLGRIVIPLKYDEIKYNQMGGDYMRGLYPVKLEYRWGIIDSTERIVVPFKYSDIWKIEHGFAIMKDAGYDRLVCIDESKREKIPNTYKYEFTFPEGLFCVKSLESGAKYTIFDTLGNKITSNKYDDIGGEFHEGLAFVVDSQKYGFIDRYGNEVIKPKYDEVEMHSFSEGLVAVNVKGDWGYIDKFDSMIIKNQYKEALPFSNGIAWAWVKKRDSIGPHNYKWILINKKGEAITKFEYDHKEMCRNTSHTIVEINGNKGILNKEGKPITDFIYRYIYEDTNGFSVIDSNGYKWFINKKGEKMQYSGVRVFSEGLAAVLDGRGRWGFIDTL